MNGTSGREIKERHREGGLGEVKSQGYLLSECWKDGKKQPAIFQSSVNRFLLNTVLVGLLQRIRTNSL